MARSHDLIVQKVLDYLQSNLSDSIELAKLCEQVNCSKSWLIKVFVKLTGKGPMAHLSELRIQKAKELLRNTDLRISEIAGASGFGSLGYFGIAFRKSAGLSPTEFRKSQREFSSQSRSMTSASAQPWFLDSMTADSLASRWQPTKGEWTQGPESVCGSGAEDYTIELARLLPDNFQLHFEMKLHGAFGTPATSVDILLCDRSGGQAFYQAILHDGYGVECVLKRSGALASENPAAQIREGVWHRIAITLRDDSYSLLIDENDLLEFRDPFPAPYEKRCRFRLVGFRSRLQIRNVRIEDLGFLPFARTIHQADALLNSGLVSQARSLYGRMLETEANPADTTELCCKIAMCHLNQGDFHSAREWAGKVPTQPATDFWAQQAALVLLQTDWRENKVSDMGVRIASLAKKTQIRCRMKGIVQQAASDFDGRGFFEQGLLLRTRLYDIEESTSIQALGSLALVCESLLAMNRLESAVTHLRELADRGRKFRHGNEYWLFTLADACNISGNAAESRDLVGEIRSRAHDESTLARCDIYEAFCLQAEGDLDAALTTLVAVPQKHPKASLLGDFARLMASHILVSIEKPKEALLLIADAERNQTWHLAAGNSSRFTFPPLLAQREFERAAQVLLCDGEVEDSRPAFHAQQVLEAALLYAIAGRKSESIRILGEIQRRFPEIRVRYFATLAGAMKRAIENLPAPGWAAEVTPLIENLPYPVRQRGEILYLAGLLFLRSGEIAGGRRLLSRISQEDHSNGWPSVLARKLLLWPDSTSQNSV